MRPAATTVARAGETVAGTSGVRSRERGLGGARWVAAPRIGMFGIGMLVTGVLMGCTGQEADLGFGEPIRVVRGEFVAGELPGEAPLPAEAPPETVAVAPRVTLVESVNNLFAPGQTEKTISGRVTEDAVAIGIRFAELGTGYWVVPAGGPEPQIEGERVWRLGFEVAHEVPPGLHALRLAAIDEAGAAGTQTELPVCVTSPIPDNLNACDPSIEPPAAVLSIAWDNGADVDLGLVDPSGKFVDSKHPTTAGGEPISPDAATDGVLTNDSHAACARDLERRENVVWQSTPAAGTYLVYVNLFSACAEQAAHFVVTFHLREAHEDGTFALVEKIRVPGELLAAQANGGAAQGLFVTSFSFQ